MENQYRMPGEFELHQGCIMIWPVRNGTWRYGGRFVREAFVQIAREIAKSETVYMLVKKEWLGEVEGIFSQDENIRLVDLVTDDSWARDTAPTFVYDSGNRLCGVDWKFNAWGGEFDGLYMDYANDDALAKRFCAYLGIPALDAHPFVMEGGAIHSDGKGTVLVTEACLLSGGRNPELSKMEIEEKLKYYLGAKKVIWLPHGIYHDETNEHVDNVAAFVRPGEVVLAWCDDESDPQHDFCIQDLEVLEREYDAQGRKLIIHKLPVPKQTICVREDEIDGFLYAEGEEERFVGERLAASYVNFYISNSSVLVPQFGDEHDAQALEILARLFPKRRVVGIAAREILLGGGNIHCITQQIPK